MTDTPDKKTDRKLYDLLTAWLKDHPEVICIGLASNHFDLDEE